MINQEKKLKVVLSDIDSDYLRDNKDSKEGDMEAEDHNKKKKYHNQRMEYM